MIKEINVQQLIKSTEDLSHKVITIAGGHHSSAWLFDKCMRTFDSDSAIESINFSVFYNSPVMKSGEVTIHRDGSMELRVTE